MQIGSCIQLAGDVFGFGCKILGRTLSLVLVGAHIALADMQKGDSRIEAPDEEPQLLEQVFAFLAIVQSKYKVLKPRK